MYTIPISQIVLRPRGSGHYPIALTCTSHFPEFPNSAGPDGLVAFGKLGHCEMDWMRTHGHTALGPNQFPNFLTGPKPNSPIFQTVLGHMG